jgi:hypothetical protein
MPKKQESIRRLLEAEKYVKNLWLEGHRFVNKSVINKMFGRQQANIALNRYFSVMRRGNNVSKKLTEIAPKDLDDLPQDRQDFILNESLTTEVLSLEPIPTEYDKTSIVCIQKENAQKAIDWCVETRKFQYIKAVRTLMTRRYWTIYYKEKTDRYFAIWPFCMTNWPGELRKLILSGSDIDLNNAIGQFIKDTLGDELDKFEEAKYYLDNPKTIRDKIVNDLGISQTQAKKILHATLNGCCTTERSIINGKSALASIVERDQALAYIETFKVLIKQLKHVRKKIAPNNKQFIRAYFMWEKEKTQEYFTGTGLIMHDGVDGCSLNTIVPINHDRLVKISDSRGVWQEEAEQNDLLVEIA